MTELVAQTEYHPSGRVRLPGVSRRAFEHPADRAAMAALRKVPGVDVLLRKLVGFIGERSLRYLHLGNAVRVGGRQLARIDRVYEECLSILDIPERPELFVAQSPIVNAGAIGVDRPFIVLNSATVSLLADDELRFVLGHELGHILSEHVLYKTMLALLLNISVQRFGVPLGGLAVFAIVAALREWDRKSELSGDRAGLLCVQDPQVAYTVQMKTAGGLDAKDMDLDALFQQAADYDAGGNALDSVVKLLNLLGRRHPFAVVRLAELRRWVDSGEYTRILRGDYPRRADDATAAIADDLKAGGESYAEAFRQSGDALTKLVNELSEAGQSAFEKAKGLWNRR